MIGSTTAPSPKRELHPYGQAWAARDLDRLLSLFSDDVVFHSPWVSGPGFVGRDSVAAILAIALDVFKDVEFTHDLGDERSHVLVANSRVLDEPINATKVLEFDAEGKIREVWMMVRPLTGLAAVAEAIGQAIVGRDPIVHELSKPLAGLAAVMNRIAARLVDDLNLSTSQIH